MPAPSKELGFGLMRLPVSGNDIDLQQVFRMTDYFLDHGFRYFDTAYFYHDGKSEGVLRAALTERHPRESFSAATKMPVSSLKEKADLPRILAEQLQRTGLDYFDRYLLHAVDAGKIELLDHLEGWQFVSDMKRKGIARQIGMSFHDKADVLDRILTAHPELDFVQLQINYADWDDSNVQSRLCCETAYRHNKPVIVMEPVKGGMLANGLPEAVQNVFHRANPKISIPAWALRFAASRPGVITVLSGMSDMDQLRDNVSVFEQFQEFTPEENNALNQVVSILKNTPRVPCTGCSYCLEECPRKIAIPNLFRVYNDYQVYGRDSARGAFEWFSRRSKPSECLRCGHCEARCPQHLPVMKYLAELADIFEK